MTYETLVGLRYLRSKRKEAFISFTTWISVIGIAIGVMALIVVIAVMTGFQDEIRERILGINPHVVVLSVDGEIREPQKVIKTVKATKGVSAAFPYTSFQAMIQGRRQLSGVLVKGVNPEDVPFMQKLVKEGSINALKKQGSVLLGRELAKNQGLLPGDSFILMVPFGGFSPMGATPETLRATVAGTIETGMYEIDNALVVMPLRDVQVATGLGASGIEVKLENVYDANAVRSSIEKSLGEVYFARTWIEMNKNLFSALKLEKMAMFIILALIIFVASFNIISSLVMTVMEKKKDVAILKAMGAKRRSIMKIFMVEGIAIGITGALIGSFFGYVICEIVKRYKIISLPEDIYYISKLPAKISLLDVGIVAGITIIISILATLYPSYKAANIDPVETLRYE